MNNIDSKILEGIITQKGRNLLEISHEKPVLMVFLRHFGCVFCREALADLANLKDEIAQRNVYVVLAHLSTEDIAQEYFQKYGLSGVDSISDPEAQYYKLFNLVKGTFNQVFGLKVWLRTIDAGIIKGHGISRKQIGDGFQMPGIFVIQNGKVLEQFIHNQVADRPNYIDLMDCCVNAAPHNID